VRLLGAVALGWATARVLDHVDPLRVAGAILMSLLALWSLLSAAIVLYGLMTGGLDA
jgi:hypothetical protein